MGNHSFSFGPFRLSPERRALYRDGKPVRLGSRALDLLIALVENGENLTSKEALIRRVWPDTFIEEANLRVHVAALRKSLGDQSGGLQYISTVSGRGYCFVAPVVRVEDMPADLVLEAEAIPCTGSDLPRLLSRIIGREQCVENLSDQLLRHRFVTIVGPGGVGKTTVAIEVAARLVDDRRCQLCFVELAHLTDGRLISGTMASVLGLPPLGDQPLASLTGQIRKESMLIVLDNCEHLLDSVAPLAEALLKAAPGVRLLTTSRQPLGAEGEFLVHLSGLDFPSTEDITTLSEALAFPAIELFAERAAASSDNFRLDESNFSAVGQICRRLDGIPLAIELAAARVNLVGVDGLAAQLHDSFALLTRGRRTALPRHQTLRATLDWSFNLIPAEEKLALARLAVLMGPFTMETAIALSAGDGELAKNGAERVLGLIEKSLITTDLTGKIARYRLLSTTREYALEKLRQSGEQDLLHLKHALHFARLARKARSDWETVPAAEWIHYYGHTIDDMRAAIDWALSSSGQQSVAFDITIDSAPLWFRLSLMDEYRERLQRALACPDIDLARKSRLRIALGHALWYAQNDVALMEENFTKALEIAEHIDDRSAQLQSLWGVWAVHRSRGEYRKALALAKRYEAVANAFGDPKSKSLANRILSVNQHYLGDQEEARRLVKMVQAQLTPSVRSVNNDFQLDAHVAMTALLSRIDWLQGFPDQAKARARQSVEAALKTSHVLSLGYAICMAGCPVALWTGDIAEAERNLRLLNKYVASNRLYSTWGRVFEIAMRLRVRTDTDSLIAQYIEARLDVCSLSVLADLDIDDLNPTELPEPIAEELWNYPELLRIKAEFVLCKGSSMAAQKEAEELLLKSLDRSKSQRLPSFELRTAVSLARLWGRTARVAEARSMLEASYGKFTEGFATTDLINADRLIAELG
ncbi:MULTISPECIES: winged helix-turn-helix domain-containing protein [unclassified Bradyrhizobium]|uniref:ATP-binding protein n=1 Tax=unclassified Bradyrhizobium TaxID=2631580 RepID=UPI0021128A57|nr:MULTISPECIES: winged helix-turn-helix domain-containing protein [unclassified Bradyrhizobium]